MSSNKEHVESVYGWEASALVFFPDRSYPAHATYGLDHTVANCVSALACKSSEGLVSGNFLLIDLCQKLTNQVGTFDLFNQGTIPFLDGSLIES